MSVLFALIFMLSAVMLVVGLIKPSLVIHWNMEKTRKNVLKVYASILLISFIGTGLTAEPKSSNKANVSNVDNKELKQEVDEDYQADRQAILDLLNQTFHSITRAESLQKDIINKMSNGNLSQAISSAQSCKYNKDITKLATKNYNDDFEDGKTEDAAEEYLSNLSESYLFFQGFCRDVEDYIDSQKPSDFAETQKSIQWHTNSKENAMSNAVALSLKYNLAYDDGAGHWRTKEIIEQEQNKLKVAQVAQSKSEPFINPKNYQNDPYGNTIARYMTAWQYKDYKKMAGMTQDSWRERESSPEGFMKNNYDLYTLTDAEILSIGYKGPAAKVAEIKISYISFGGKKENGLIRAMIIEEEYSIGVNPLSTLRIKEL